MPPFSPSNSLGDVASLADVYTSSALRAGVWNKKTVVWFFTKAPLEDTPLGRAVSVFPERLNWWVKVTLNVDRTLWAKIWVEKKGGGIELQKHLS